MSIAIVSGTGFLGTAIAEALVAQGETPLRIARGIQNKVLEAMSMQRPVIATPGAMTGIQPFAGFEPTISEDADTLVEAAVGLLSQPPTVAPAGRECVLQRYNWDANLQRIERLLESGRIEPDL